MSSFSRITEALLRRLLYLPIRLLVRRKGRGPTHPPERILLLRHDRIGDWVISTPLIQQLRRRFPNAEIDVIASVRNAILPSEDSRITRTHIFPPGYRARIELIRRCRHLDYDLAMQLVLGRTTLGTIFLRLCAPGAWLVGYHNPRTAWMFDSTTSTSDPHFAARTTSLIRAVASESDGNPEPSHYSVDIPRDIQDWAHATVIKHGLEPQEFILVNISAGSAARDLDETFAVPLIRKLRRMSMRVAVISDPAHIDRLERICKRGGAMPLIVPSLLHAIGVYSCAGIVITPDTSVVHLASAVGRPLVALYLTPNGPVEWGPRGVPARTLSIPSSTSRIADMDSDVVVDATLDLMATLALRTNRT